MLLHSAVEKKERQKEIIKALLSHKEISMNIKINEEQTPLDILSEWDSSERNEFLSSAGQRGYYVELRDEIIIWEKEQMKNTCFITLLFSLEQYFILLFYSSNILKLY